jgi:hypothetical protein
MATLTTQTISRAGIAETLVAAAAGGDACEVGNSVFLKVFNGGAGPVSVTLNVAAGVTALGEAVANRVVSVPAGQRWYIGPISASLYRSPTTGLCSITYSAVTSVTVGVFLLSGQ